MSIQNFKDLTIWQNGIELSCTIYKLVEQLPKNEMYALSDQMRRASISVPSNIAEGHQRVSTKEYIRFLSISRGSLGELETQLVIANRIGHISAEQLQQVSASIESERRMINALISTLRKKLNPIL